jgi:4-amino-4-deoxy-L-arabinose transferase-like glycosyltransferase
VLHGGILVFVASATFFLGLGRLPLLEPDEGRNAEIAREMLTLAHWAVPHFDGLAYLDKPPLLFWLMAGSFKLFGLSEWAARLPSALAALIALLLVARLGREMFGRSVGLRSGVIFATAPLAIVFARLVIFDMPLTLLVAAALACFWRGEGKPARPLGNDLMFFAAMGLATLTKGPIGFLLPLLIIFSYLAIRRRLSSFGRLRWKWGLAIFMLIVLPWFVFVCLGHPDFPRYAFWDESLRRFATSREHRTGSPLYYLPVYLAGFLPWSFFLLAFGLSRIKKWRELLQESSAPVLFLICWAGVVFVFFSISQSKLPGYFLPAIIPLSILMGKAWTEAEAEANANARVPGWVTIGFGALVALGLAGLLASQLLGLSSLRQRLAHKMPSGVLALIRPEVFYSSLIMIALAIVGRDCIGRGRRRYAGAAAFGVLALTAPLLILRWVRPLSLYAAANSSRALAETIQASPERDLPVYGLYYFRTGLPFYLRRPVGLITTDADELTSNYIASRWRRMRKDTPGLFLSKSEAERTMPWDPNEPLLVRGKDWRGPQQSSPLLVITRGTQVPAFADRGDNIEPLWSGWQYSVWKVVATER